MIVDQGRAGTLGLWAVMGLLAMTAVGVMAQSGEGSSRVYDRRVAPSGGATQGLGGVRVGATNPRPTHTPVPSIAAQDFVFTVRGKDRQGIEQPITTARFLRNDRVLTASLGPNPGEYRLQVPGTTRTGLAQIAIESEDFLKLDWRPTAKELSSTGTVVVLKRANRVEGRVVDSSDEGVPGVLVGRRTGHNQMAARTVQTDGSGRFVLGNLPQGPVILNFLPPLGPLGPSAARGEAEGHQGRRWAPQSFPIYFAGNGETETLRNVVLEEEAQLTIRLRRSDGTAVEGMRVALRSQPDLTTGSQITNASGEARFTGLMSGPLTLSIGDETFHEPLMMEAGTTAPLDLVVTPQRMEFRLPQPGFARGYQLHWRTRDRTGSVTVAARQTSVGFVRSLSEEPVEVFLTGDHVLQVAPLKLELSREARATTEVVELDQEGLWFFGSAQDDQRRTIRDGEVIWIGAKGERKPEFSDEKRPRTGPLGEFFLVRPLTPEVGTVFVHQSSRNMMGGRKWGRPDGLARRTSETVTLMGGFQRFEIRGKVGECGTSAPLARVQAIQGGLDYGFLAKPMGRQDLPMGWSLVLPGQQPVEFGAQTDGLIWESQRAMGSRGTTRTVELNARRMAEWHLDTRAVLGTRGRFLGDVRLFPLNGGEEAWAALHASFTDGGFLPSGSYRMTVVLRDGAPAERVVELKEGHTTRLRLRKRDGTESGFEIVPASGGR